MVGSDNQSWVVAHFAQVLQSLCWLMYRGRGGVGGGSVRGEWEGECEGGEGDRGEGRKMGNREGEEKERRKRGRGGVENWYG